MIDLAPPPLWLPAKPAIIRAHQGDLDALKALEREKGIKAMLPGMVPVIVNAAAADPLAFSLFDSATNISGNTISIPASIQADDLAIIAEYAVVESSTTPSGFSSALRQEVASFTWLTVSYKKLVGTETTITCSTDIGYGMARVLRVYRPNKIWSTVTAGSWTVNYGGASAPSNRSVTAGGQNGPLIVFGVKGGTDNALSLTGNPAFQSTLAANNVASGAIDIMLGHLIYNEDETPVNNTVSGGDDAEFNTLAAGYLKMAV
jgi:hypothetical protein